jgi:hypothetical protein
MAPDLLTKFAEDAADTNRRAAVSAEQEARRLGTAPPDARDEVAREAVRGGRYVVRVALATAPLAGELWDDFRSRLAKAMPVDQAAAALRGGVLAVAESWQRLAAAARTLWAAAEASGARPDDYDVEARAKLDAEGRSVAAVREGSERLLIALTRPRPPVDPDRLARAKEAAAAGAWVPLEDARRRLTGDPT